MRTTLAALFVVALCVPVVAAIVDPRLAAAKTAFVAPLRDHEDDRVVAACLAEHLPIATPLTLAATAAEADVVFTVKGKVPGVAGAAFAFYGNAPNAEIAAALPNGTRLWADKVKKRAATLDGSQSLACHLADGLIESLRDAVRKSLAAKTW